MKSRFKFENPGEILATVTITAPVSEWEKLRDQIDASIGHAWPASDLKYQINDVLAQARKILWAKEPDKEG